LASPASRDRQTATDGGSTEGTVRFQKWCPRPWAVVSSPPDGAGESMAGRTCVLQTVGRGPGPPSSNTATPPKPRSNLAWFQLRVCFPRRRTLARRLLFTASGFGPPTTTFTASFGRRARKRSVGPPTRKPSTASGRKPSGPSDGLAGRAAVRLRPTRQTVPVQGRRLQLVHSTTQPTACRPPTASTSGPRTERARSARSRSAQRRRCVVLFFDAGAGRQLNEAWSWPARQRGRSLGTAVPRRPRKFTWSLRFDRPEPRSTGRSRGPAPAGTGRSSRPVRKLSRSGKRSGPDRQTVSAQSAKNVKASSISLAVPRTRSLPGPPARVSREPP